MSSHPPVSVFHCLPLGARPGGRFFGFPFFVFDGVCCTDSGCSSVPWELSAFMSFLPSLAERAEAEVWVGDERGEVGDERGEVGEEEDDDAAEGDARLRFRSGLSARFRCPFTWTGRSFRRKDREQMGHGWRCGEVFCTAWWSLSSSSSPPPTASPTVGQTALEAPPSSASSAAPAAPADLDDLGVAADVMVALLGAMGASCGSVD